MRQLRIESAWPRLRSRVVLAAARLVMPRASHLARDAQGAALPGRPAVAALRSGLRDRVAQVRPVETVGGDQLRRAAAIHLAPLSTHGCRGLATQSPSPRRGP